MRKIRIRNYQSLSDVDVDVDGFTVIVGPTNSGKSSVIRAFKALLENQRGNAFIRAGETECSVTLESPQDDLEVTWTKGSSASYLIRRGEETTELTSVGQGRQSFLDELGFREVRSGKVRLCPQLGSQWPMEPFLLQKSGSVIAEAITSVSGVDRVPHAIRLSEKDLRGLKSELSVRESELSEGRDRLTRFEGVDEVRILVDTVEEVLARSKKIETVVSSVRELWSDLSSSGRCLKSLQGVDGISVPDSVDVSELSNELERVSLLGRELDRTSSVLDTLRGVPGVPVPECPSKRAEEFVELAELESDLRSSRLLVSSLDGLVDVDVPFLRQDLSEELTEIRSLWSELSSSKLMLDRLEGFDFEELKVRSVDEIKSLLERVSEMHELFSDAERHRRSVTELESGLVEVESSIAEVHADLSTMIGDVCPVCGQEIDDV